MPTLSFRSKVILAGIGVQIVAVSALSLNSARLIDSALGDALERRVEQLRPLFSAALSAPLIERDFATLESILTESRVAGDIDYLVVTDTRGRVVAVSGWPRSVPLPDPQAPQPVRKTDGHLRFDFAVPILVAAQTLGDLHYGLTGDFIEHARLDLIWRIVIAGVFALLVFCGLLAMLCYRLTRSLEQLAVASRQIRDGNYDVQLAPCGDDEIGALTEDFRHMSAEVKKRIAETARAEREKANLEMELRIQEAVAGEAKKVKILVDNMQQALFSISPDGTIVEPVSVYSSHLFGAEIVGRNFMDVLYKDLQGGDEELSAIRSAMVSVFDEDEIEWMLMEKNFPTKVHYLPDATTPDDRGKILNVSPAAIWDANDKLERILFVVEDVTTQEALERQVSEHRKQAGRLIEILMNKPEELMALVHRMSLTIARCRELVADIDPAGFAAILRDMHAMKGVARSYKLKGLSEAIHDTESTLDGLTAAAVPDGKAIDVGLAALEEVVGEYHALLEKVYANRAPAAGPVRSGAAARKSLRSLTDRLESTVKEMAQQLGKQARLEVIGDAVVEASVFDQLEECLIQLLANAVDHGIESPEGRRARGKDRTGSIRLRLGDESGEVSVVVEDDGAGVEGRTDLIFSLGYSMRETVTDVSGRGIGLNVVKATIESLGGSVVVESQPSIGTKFTIKLRNTDARQDER